METKLNILHYCVYLIHYKVHLFLLKYNPFNLLHKLPFQKRRYKQLGINIQDEIEKAFSDPHFGLSVLISGGILIGLTFLTILTITLILLKLIDLNFVLNWYHFTILGLLSYVICYLNIFKSDKYLEYFNEFKDWTEPKKKQSLIISLSFIFLIILVFFAVLFS